MESRLGVLLRGWRAQRGLSQLGLAMRANTSQRHLSFVESGRAQPSREWVLGLVEALDVPLRARNEILLAAGYAPAYPERPLEAQEMGIVSQALARLLTHHEPYPAMVLDGAWNILMRNATSARVFGSCVDEKAMAMLSPDGRLNFMRMMFAADGMRRHVLSWAHTGPVLLARLQREASAQPASPSEQLLAELRGSGAAPMPITAFVDEPLEPVIPLELELDGTRLRLFNTITTLGTPQDVTLQELRVEMAFPADDATDQFLRQWAAAPADTRPASGSASAAP